MEIFLTEQCKSLTGSLGRGFGYSIRPYKSKKGVRFFAKRDSKGVIPHDGHWRFIVACAKLAQNKLHIEDIQVDWLELQTALYEAKHFTASEQVRRNYAPLSGARDVRHELNARDIINLKTTFGL